MLYLTVKVKCCVSNTLACLVVPVLFFLPHPCQDYGRLVYLASRFSTTLRPPLASAASASSALVTASRNVASAPRLVEATHQNHQTLDNGQFDSLNLGFLPQHLQNFVYLFPKNCIRIIKDQSCFLVDINGFPEGFLFLPSPLLLPQLLHHPWLLLSALPK